MSLGESDYDNVVYCNFEIDKNLSKLFESSLNPKDIIKNLELMKGTKINES